MITYTYKAKVMRVVDGDTIDLDISVGFKVLVHQRIRLARVDAEEIKDPDTAKRLKANEQKLQLVDTMLNAVDVEVATSKSDIYGRYIGEISYVNPKEPKTRIMLSDFLLKSGWRKYE